MTNNTPNTDEQRIDEFRTRTRAKLAADRASGETPEARNEQQQRVEQLVRAKAERIAPQLINNPELLTEAIFELLMLGESGRMAGGFGAASIMDKLPEDHFLRQLAHRASRLHATSAGLTGPRLGDKLLELAD